VPVKKKKKFKQRLQHSVRFDIAFDAWNEFRDTSKPLINFVQAGSISDKKFLVGDLILSINNTKIKTVGDLDFEVNKIDWGDEVSFEVKRLDKIEKVKIKTISIKSYHKNHVTWPCHVKVKNNLVSIEKQAFEYPDFDGSVENGDILISIDSEKISSEFDFGRVTSKYKPGNNVEFRIKKKDKSKDLPPVDGVMIGRAVIKKPKFLQNLEKKIYPNSKFKVKNTEEIIKELQLYFDHQQKLGEKKTNITKQWHGLFSSSSGAKKWRKSLSEGMSPVEAYESIFYLL